MTHFLNCALSLSQYCQEIVADHKASSSECIVIDEVDKEVITKMCLYARCELPGFSAFLGGLVAQEVTSSPSNVFLSLFPS